MAVIYLNPVGVFKCLFTGVSPTKNPDYLKFNVSLETEIPGYPLKESMVVPASDKELMQKITSIEVGKSIQVGLAVTLKPAQSEGGKSYPARPQYKLIKIY